MARPIKNYCDYFSHDRDMRNHRKVKAIRSKFGISGYGIWVMVLEYLTGIDANVFEYSDLEFELMGGDFGVDSSEIKSVVDYCINLEMLQLENGFIKSESLDERLKIVYDKRKTNKDLSKQQQRVNGSFCSNNPASSVVSVAETPVSVAEMPQSKVKKSIVNKIKEKESKEEAIELPFNGEFGNVWVKWVEYKKKEHRFSYKTKESQQAALSELVKLSGGNEQNAIEIIAQSMANGWKGFFELKKVKSINNDTRQQFRDDLQAEFNRRYS